MEDEEEEEVNDEPENPADEATGLDDLEVADGARAPDRGQVALVVIAKRRGRLTG